LIQIETFIWGLNEEMLVLCMRDRKLVAVCMLALVIVAAFVQVLPEAPQHEDVSIHPSEIIPAFSGPDFDNNPCGGGGGDDGGGSAPR